MNTMNDPLSEEEMDELDRFLLYRGGDADDVDAAYVDDADEGVLCLSELDGFLAAVVSGPVAIAPSRWLPAVWGDEAPRWENEEAFERIFDLMARHMNDVIGSLSDPEYGFEPLFNEREVDGNHYLLVDEWCEGYLRGVALAAAEWDEGGEDLVELLAPILLFATEQGWELLQDRGDDEVAAMQDAIPDTVDVIYAFWQERRAPPPPVMREAPKVGGNDPCPCGSGRKYKHCCLN